MGQPCSEQAPVWGVCKDGIDLAPLLHVGLDVLVHQAACDPTGKLLGLELAGVWAPHLRVKQGGAPTAGGVAGRLQRCCRLQQQWGTIRREGLYAQCV